MSVWWPAFSLHPWAVLPLGWNHLWDSVELPLIGTVSRRPGFGADVAGHGTLSWLDFEGALLTNVILAKNQSSPASGSSWPPLWFSAAEVRERQPGPGLRGCSQGQLHLLFPLCTARYSGQPARHPSAPATCCGNKGNKTNIRSTWFPVNLAEFQCWSGCRGKGTYAFWGLTTCIEPLKNGHALSDPSSERPGMPVCPPNTSTHVPPNPMGCLGGTLGSETAA